jgi:hypothetical protein
MRRREFITLTGGAGVAMSAVAAKASQLLHYGKRR